ncbi:MAG: mismatch-specific DNA-glycosylase [Candidimonas sp.]|nr:MAG: mismatch-specific DNA-glycosylase [Candidimonas sp.]TAM26524.1 MAG: mismatch-specific DNA-glycosylase [Candidimonas sp.]
MTITPMQTLPDIIAKDLAVVFCGINPGLQAATIGHHFAGRSNRFWRAIHLAGFTPEQVRAENDRTLLAYGCGLTTAVERPTVLSRQRKVQWGPQPTAFAGAIVWVLPNPSGLNRAFNLDNLVQAYRQLYLEVARASDNR